MAVHFSFAASKYRTSVPCIGESLSLTELKDAIAAPLVTALNGRKLREAFDFRVFDGDTKSEILGVNSRIRKNASVIVKRVPYFQLKTQSSNVAPLSTISTQCIERSNGSSTRSEVVDDDFGDIYTAPPPPLVQKPSNKHAQVPSNSTCSEVIDDEFGDNVYSTLTVEKSSKKRAASSDILLSSKKRAAPSDELMSSKQRIKETIESDFASKQLVEAVNIRSKQEIDKDFSVQFVKKIPNGKREESAVPSVEKIPKELTCLLCNNILKEPMMIPCCFLTFCGDCIKVEFAKQKTCPNCQSCKFGVENLLHNRHLNIMIDAHFKSSTSASNPTKHIQ